MISTIDTKQLDKINIKSNLDFPQTGSGPLSPSARKAILRLVKQKRAEVLKFHG